MLVTVQMTPTRAITVTMATMTAMNTVALRVWRMYFCSTVSPGRVAAVPGAGRPLGMPAELGCWGQRAWPGACSGAEAGPAPRADGLWVSCTPARSAATSTVAVAASPNVPAAAERAPCSRLPSFRKGACLLPQLVQNTSLIPNSDPQLEQVLIRPPSGDNLILAKS